MAYVSASFRERQKQAEKIKKEQEKNIKSSTVEICDNCSNGTWADYEGNRRISDGHPLTIRCPYYEDGKYGLNMGTPACKNFKKK